MPFFQASRQGSKIIVSIEREPNPEPNPDGTHDLFGETVEQATLADPEAIEWLVARGCWRSEAVRIVELARTVLMGQSTGAVPTTTEWELDQPVTRETD